MSRKKRRNKITVRHSDGSVEVVKPGHFRSLGPRKRRTSYEAYLRSRHWGQIRDAALMRDGHRCASCGLREHLEVHHHTYERLGHELLEDVVTLCRGCHVAYHRDGRPIPVVSPLASPEAIAVPTESGRDRMAREARQAQRRRRQDESLWESAQRAVKPVR